MTSTTAVLLAIKSLETALVLAPKFTAALGLTKQSLDAAKAEWYASRASVQQLADEAGIDVDFVPRMPGETPPPEAAQATGATEPQESANT
ncbi:MAG: hypothetical protein AAF797_17580 [Planctomycetota bacterium]